MLRKLASIFERIVMKQSADEPGEARPRKSRLAASRARGRSA
jgi:hypothetical protein